tara:strand:+ start:265 stop:1596 length:1332 start_codon:yes stop_codon:yes gene_type:complete
MLALTSTFLLKGKSFNLSKDEDTGTQTVERNNDISLTPEEILNAGNYYNAAESKIDWATISSWDKDSYLDVLGASDDEIEKTLNDPNAKNIFMDAAGEDPNNIGLGNIADAIEGGGILRNMGGMYNTGRANYGTSYDDDAQSLVYPLNRDPDDNFDYLQVVGYKYIPGSGSKDWKFDSGVKKKEDGGGYDITDTSSQYLDTPSSRYTSDKRKKNIMGTARLPMTGAISESNSVGWGKDNLNALQLAGARLAESGITGLTSGNFEQMFSENSAVIKQAFGDIGKEQIKAFFAGEAVGANIFTRGTGMILNPNLELLFNGPDLRTFQYSFNFTPREPAEAQNVKNIIRFFKQNMAAKRSKGNTFLESPNVFQLKYLTQGGEEHPFLNNLKLAALTNFTVNYTPANQYMTYEENKSMTSYQVGMTFNELEPVLFDDYNEKLSTMGY